MRKKLILCAIIGSSAGASCYAHAARELASFCVERYRGSSFDECGPLSTLNHSCAQETAFQQEISLYTGSQEFEDQYRERSQNSNVNGRDWLDVSQSGSDDDVQEGTDWADIVMFSGHGSANDPGNCTYTRIVMGNDSETCIPTFTNGIRLGTGDADALVVDATQSLQKCVWDNGEFFKLDDGNSGSALSVFNGYHGSPSDDSHGVQEIGDYAYYAKTSGLGEEWLDAMITWNTAPITDDCPMSLVFADNEAKAEDAFYDAGLADTISTGTHDEEHIFYFAGCNPALGDEL